MGDLWEGFPAEPSYAQKQINGRPMESYSCKPILYLETDKGTYEESFLQNHLALRNN